MKNRLISLSFAILSLFAVASCKTADVDPRDQYVGSYNLTATQQATGSNGASSTSVYKFNLTVAKGKATDELTFTDATDTYTATLKNNAFDVAGYTTTVPYNGSNVAVRTIGNGSFSGSSVNLNTVASTVITGVTITITKTGNGPKYK